jgi:hypothetical protein
MNVAIVTKLARLIALRGKLAGIPAFGPAAHVTEALDLSLGLIGDLIAELERIDREFDRIDAELAGKRDPNSQ